MNATTSSVEPPYLPEPNLLTAIRPLILRVEAERDGLIETNSVDGVLQADDALQGLLNEMEIEIAAAHFAVAREGVL